ncbi:MAG: M14 family metallopeptidase [Bacteroidales bacterium]|jgi:hypothetical protein|nr:M14 family metallopeptidase [Bacteroidales bacterium]
MKKKSLLSAVGILLFSAFFPAPSVAQYHSNSELTSRIRELGTKYPQLCTVRSLGKTSAGNDIWLISIGTGNRDSKPAMAVVSGVDGKHIPGRELALGFATRILQNSTKNQIRDLLEKMTFYVIPDASPEASSQFSSPIRYERSVNSRPTDDDRDFQTDEDPCEDLNGDGLITLIRIKDPAGKYLISSEDERIMAEADLSKGETGSYHVFTEGTDNDKDGKFNEDGAGGVSFNRNFTYNYEEFGAGTGLYPVSEPETKAVADFLFDRFNVYSVITFGPQDNLGQPMKAPDRQTDAGRQNQDPDQGFTRMQRTKITSIMKSDETINRLVSEKYHSITGLKGSPAPVSEPGNFMEWAYFHYGRYSFSTPGWWFSYEKGKNAGAELLKKSGNEKSSELFVPWTVTDHPDFPGKTVEVGGLKPFALINPPADSLPGLIESHYEFITEVAAMHPELEFLDLKSENAGENIFRISLLVHNKGLFATCAEIGDQNIWTRIMRINLEPSKGQTILSGSKVQRIRRLLGDESAEFSWLISGKGTVRISAGSDAVGTISLPVGLK